uniref:RdRp n=1 Tax=viral metagenome TaxID=1070528 RepID=A0A2V0RKS5_9ZZZZ
MSLAEAVKPHLLWETELEQFEKFGALSSAAPGWSVTTKPLEGDDPPIGRGKLWAVYEKAFDYLEAETRPPPPTNYRYRKNTNHGSPDWNNSNDSLVWHIKRGIDIRKDGMSLQDAAAEHERWFPGLGDLSFAATMFSRTGPNRKPITEWNVTSGRAIDTTEFYYCRRRAVFGLPTWINVVLRPMAIKMKSIIYGVHAHFHTTPERIAWKSGSLTMMSDDISGFDLSVSYWHQEILAKWYSKFSSPYLARCYEELITLPIIAPPIGGMKSTRAGDKLIVNAFHTAELLPTKGITKSGSVLTTIDGTVINFARCLYAASRAWSACSHLDFKKGIDYVISKLRSSDLELYIQGDDVLWAGDGLDDFDHDAYVQASADFGFKCALSPDPIFLMQVVDRKNKRSYGLLSRFLQNTMFRERPKFDPIIERLSLATRVEKTLGFPGIRPVLNDLFNPLFRDKFGITWQQLVMDLKSGLLISQASKKDAGGFMDWLLGMARGDIEALDTTELGMLLGTSGIGQTALENFINNQTITSSSELVRRAEDINVPLDNNIVSEVWERRS